MTTIPHREGLRAATSMMAALLLGVCVLAPRALAEESPAERAFNDGVRKAEAGDAEGAIAAYTDAIALDPDLADAYNNRGLLQAHGGDCVSAIADYDHTLRIDGTHVRALVNRSWCRRRQDDLSGALADLEVATRIDPRNPTAVFHRGVLKNELGDLDGARADFKRSLRIRSGFAPAHHHLGRIHRRRGAYREAIAQFDRALALDPTLVESWVDRGLARRDMGDADGAVEDFSGAIDLEPDRALPWSERGRLRYDREKHELAVSDLRRHCELAPSDQDCSRLYIWLARSAGGDVEGASTELARYVDEERSASESDWAAQLAGVLLGRVDGDALLASVGEAEDEVLARGRRCEAFFYIGSRKMIDGDATEAASAWRRCVATDMKERVEYDSAVAALARYEAQHAAVGRGTSRVATGAEADKEIEQ